MTATSALQPHSRRLYAVLAALLFVLAWLLPLCSHAQDVLPIPALTAPVIDQTGTLSTADKEALEGKLKAYEKEKGSQIVVLMVATTKPEDIAQYAWRVASDWKIGRKGVGDGVLIVVAKDDRRMRIEVAKDLEGALPDTAAARIIDTTMKPRFRANDYAGGISDAVDQITARLKGEELPAVGASGQGDGSDLDADGLALLAKICVVCFVAPMLGKRLLCSRLGRGKGVVATTALTAAGSFLYSMDGYSALLSGLCCLVAIIFMTRQGGAGSSGGGSGFSGGGWSGGSGGGSSSSGSSGYSSGGGGDFGGGGASGDW